MVPQGKCPDCGQAVGTQPGKETVIHSARGKQGPCSGVGKPARPL
jgi:hypothetical protein